ncbi:hypothetical protein BH10CHL1_BH10CHL1_39980 [soil metagenome]
MPDTVMREIGVRELKNQATEILREVREQQAEYIVTYHGKPVARILPFDAPINSGRDDSVASSGSAPEDIWAEWDELSRKIDQTQPIMQSAVDILFEMRRDRDRSLAGIQ